MSPYIGEHVKGNRRLKIHDLARQGWTARQIATHLDLTPSRVRDIAKRDDFTLAKARRGRPPKSVVCASPKADTNETR